MSPVESVLLVGGSGFLGLHLIEAFWNVTPRPRIHVFDVRELPSITPQEGVYSFDTSKITVHIGDLTSKADVVAAIEKAKPQVVVHSASPIHGLGSAIYEKVNVKGTEVLVEACTQSSSVKSLVYTSSGGVVFNGEDLFGVDERTPYPLKHMDAYNKTKEQGEQIVLKANSPELSTVSLRPAGIFGPGDRQMIPGLRQVAARGKHRVQLGDNNNLFDVTYVGNVAYAHVLAAEKLVSGQIEGIAGGTFFITNDSPIFFFSFARQVWKMDGHDEEPRFAIPRGVSVILGYLSQWGAFLVGNKDPSFTAFRVRLACATRFYDISKAKSLLGYEPKWSIEEALQLTFKSLEASQ